MQIESIIELFLDIAELCCSEHDYDKASKFYKAAFKLVDNLSQHFV